MTKLRLRRAAGPPGQPEGIDAIAGLPLPEGAPVPKPFAEAAAAARFCGREGQAVLLSPQGPALLGLGPAPAKPLALEAAGAAALSLPLPGGRALALDARALEPAQAARLAVGAALAAWRFDRHRTTAAPEEQRLPPRRLLLLADACEEAALAWAREEAAVRGALLARELVAEPANHLTPRAFARRLKALEKHGIKVEVLGPKRLARRGFGALLAVGSGAAEGPYLAVLRWPGEIKAPPVAFIGKGLCFDTGGISIKPVAGMEEMRADMAGAAACAGAMLSLALRRSPAPAVAVLAIAENATGAASYRPGDVIRTLSGRTVEVVDTDAEGRLVLADALHHAATEFAPQAMVDLATLTGAVVTALGNHRAGLFSSDAPLAAACAAAGEAVGEHLWELPIGARHREDLLSDIADLKQCVPAGTGRPQPDASHAAAFLREFIGGVPWAHLDIAGVDTKKDAGPTGFGVRLLDRLVEMQFEDPHRL
jgi:leucyl aminopeptidase